MRESIRENETTPARGATVEKETPVAQVARHGMEKETPVAQVARHGMEKETPGAQIARHGMKKTNPVAQIARHGMEKENPVAQVARHGMEREQADTGIGAGAAKATYNGVFRVLNPSHGAVKGDTPAIVDTGAGISIVNDHHLLDPKTLQETDTTIIGVGGQQKATIKGLAHVVVETLDGQPVRWAFPAVYQPLCPENLIAVRDSDGLNIWNDRGVFHAKFSIVATDGSTRQIKIREHPRIEGVPCVDIRATSRRQRNRPDEEAPKELDVPAVVNINHSMTGVMGAEFQALRTNQLKHASLGHFANGSALRRAVENGSLKITANKEFFDQDQRNRCQQCLLTSRRD